MIVTKEKSLSNANIATITEQFILVNSLEFLKALRKVVNATAGKKSPYPVLQYVHVRIESDCLIIEACDSLVLDLLTVSASVEPELIGKDFLISKSFVKSLVKAPHKFGSRLSIRPSLIMHRLDTRYFSNGRKAPLKHHRCFFFAFFLSLTSHINMI